MQTNIIQMKQKKFTLVKYTQTIKNTLGIILVALLLFSCGSGSGSGSGDGSNSTSLVLAITTNSARIASGANIALTANIQNNGKAILDSATLKIYKSSDITISDSDTSLEDISIASIAVDANLNFTRNVIGPSAGILYYGACLDISGGDSATNSICSEGVVVEVIPADLRIARFSATPLLITSSADIRLTARVQNIGDATSTKASLRFYRSSDNTIDLSDEFLTAVSLANVNADTSRDFSISRQGHSAGTLYYGACLSDVSGEIATNNNCSSGVAINSFPLVNVDNTTDNATLQLLGAISVTTTQIGSATYLFVVGNTDSGVSVFQVANDGSLTNVDNTRDGGDLQLGGAYSVTTAQIGSATYLFVAGSLNDGVSVFSVANDGSLANVDNTTDNATLELNGAYSVTTSQIGSATYLFVVGLDDSGVSVFEVSDDGNLTNVENTTDNTGDLQLLGASFVHTAQIGSSNYLFVTGFDDNGLSVFQVADNGRLRNVYNIQDNPELELNGAFSVTTAQIGSATYLFVAGISDNGVSVFEVAANGSLTNIDNITDNAELNLDGANSVATAQIGSATYLFVSARDDDGVSIFQVANNGSLTNIANIADNGDLQLDGAFSVTTAQIGSDTYLFVAGFNDNGVSVFRIDNDALTDSSSASGNLNSAVSHALNIRRGRSYAGNIASSFSSGNSSGITFDNSRKPLSSVFTRRGFYLCYERQS